MPILKRHLERVISRKIKSGKLTAKQAAAAQAMLDNPTALRELNKRVNGLATSQGVKAIGDGAILAWIAANWKTILDIILTIISMFG